MLNRRGSSKTDTLIKTLLMFFVILLSFSAGTFLGKQFSDSQHKLSALENNHESEEAESRETASVPPNSLEVKPEDALTDEDIAKLSEEFSNPEKDSASNENGEHAANEEHGAEHAKTAAADEHGGGHGETPKENSHGNAKKPAAKHEANENAKVEKGQAEKGHGEKLAEEIHGVQKAAERVAKGHEPTEPHVKAESRVPSSLPGTATAVGKYTIQVSSYQNEEDAKKHAENLKSKGFSAFYIPAEIKGTKWYRVSVGLFATKLEATNFMDDFKKQTNVNAALVQKIVQ